eukprot:gene23318-30558_t
MGAQPEADLGSRLDRVFGSLGADSAPEWKLQQDVKPFQGGSKSIDAYSSDEDNEASAPKPLMHLDSDVEGEGEEEQGFEDGEACRQNRSARCDAHLRLAFEAEEEEDVFDSFAVSTMRMARSKKAGAGAMELEAVEPNERPDGDMEVLDDNPFDRMCTLRHGQNLGEEGSAVAHTSSASTSAAATAAGGAADTGPTMSWAARMAAAAAEKEAALPGSESDKGGHSEEPSSRSKEPSDGEPKSSKRRVRFAVNETSDGGGGGGAEGDGGSGGGGGQDSGHMDVDADVGGRGAGRRGAGGSDRREGGRGGGQGRGRRGALDWQRPGFVPDHVRNPEKYTVYSFEAPVVVGSDLPGAKASRPQEEAPQKVVSDVGASDYQQVQEPAGERDTLHDPERAPVVFGSGNSDASKSESSKKAGTTRMLTQSGLACLQEAEEGGGEEAEQGAGSMAVDLPAAAPTGSVGKGPQGGGRRKIRVKPTED